MRRPEGIEVWSPAKGMNCRWTGRETEREGDRERDTHTDGRRQREEKEKVFPSRLDMTHLHTTAILHKAYNSSTCSTS